jgi:hypothetical protein
MAESEKTCQFFCEECDKPFHVRLPLVDPDVEGDVRVILECPYCKAQVKVNMPQKSLEPKILDREPPGDLGQ